MAKLHFRLSLSYGLLCQIVRKIENRRMRNRTYGGVRGRKTKVGRKLSFSSYSIVHCTIRI